MASGFRSLSPNININTSSGQLRTELQNTFARLDGTLALAPYRMVVQTGPVGCVGSTETDLMSTSIDQGTMTLTGQTLLILAAGTTNANGNNKTFKLKLGSTTLFTSGAIALNNKDWYFQGQVIYNGGSAQLSWGQFTSNGSASVVDVNSGSEAWATNLTLKITGTGGATDDIAATFWQVILIK